MVAIHKANIMKLADGLFLRCCREVAARHPHIEYKELIVDNAAMQLVVRPETFDILLLPNLYGDIVSDLAAGLVGGLGMVPGANMGEKDAVFEAVHGSAPDIAGKGIANPTAMMLSSVLMLSHLKELESGGAPAAGGRKSLRRGQAHDAGRGRQGDDDRIHRRRDRGHVISGHVLKRVGRAHYLAPWTISSTKNVRPGCCMLSTLGFSAIGSA